MGIVSLLSTLLLTYVWIVNGESECLTPNGDNGNCKSINECPSLLAISKDENATPEKLKLLQQSQCGVINDGPKVCCTDPNPCFTPEGKPGKCISIYSCPHLYKLANGTLTEKNIKYLQNSRCTGLEKYSLCCGAPPVEVKRGNCANRMSAFPIDPATDCCGRDMGYRYLISYETSIDQYPWTALIEYKKQLETKVLCGGALISGRYVLTAARCFVGDILKQGIPKHVRLGDYIINNEGVDCVEAPGGGQDCSDEPRRISIESTISHPKYSTLTQVHDIGLIRLERNAPYTDFIRPICLPSSDATVNVPPYENIYLYIAGWGIRPHEVTFTDKKLHANLPYVKNDECKGAYVSPGNTNFTLTTGQMCAGGKDGIRTFCIGDTGGPLMLKKESYYEVTGVNSYGLAECNPKVPRVYTNVYKYIDWIRQNIVA